MALQDLKNLNVANIECKNCDTSYQVKWDDEDAEPTSCPFCGADTSIDEEDAIFDDEEEQDNWN